MSGIRVRPLTESDWAAVEEIYRQGIDSGHATFEQSTPSWEAFSAARHPSLRLVAVAGDSVLGWVAASAVSARAAYAGVVEHSLYVAASARGNGVGAGLLTELVSAAEAAGVWTIQSNVFPENAASLRLHRRHGFREVGRRERIALMTYGPLAGTWRDTILIERRS